MSGDTDEFPDVLRVDPAPKSEEVGLLFGDDEDIDTTVVAADETTDMRQNREALKDDLEAEGFGLVRVRALSQFTMVLHTGPLPERKQLAFEQWAREQESFEQLDDDLDGGLWRVNI